LAAAFSPPTFLAGTSQHGSDEGGVEEKERFGSDPPVDDGGTAEEAKLPDARGETPCGAHTLRPFARASDEGGRIKGAKPGETIIESAIHFVQTFCMRCQRCLRIGGVIAETRDLSAVPDSAPASMARHRTSHPHARPRAHARALISAQDT